MGQGGFFYAPGQPGDTRKERDLELDKPITEVIIDDELEAVASDAQPQEEQKPAEEPAPVELKPEQQPQQEPHKSDLDEPSNRAFAHFRNENKSLKQQNDELKRKLDAISERSTGKVLLSEDEHRAYLNYLADTDPDAWHAETLRRSQEQATADALEQFEKRFAPQRQEAEAQSDITAIYQQTQAAIDQRIDTAFPEINKQGSPENKAFVEEVMRRVGSGSPEEKQQRFLELVVSDPQQILDIAERVTLRTRLATMTSAQSESGRLARVNQQGATASTPDTQSKPITLTPEEAAFAKRNGWTLEEFAAFNARSK